VNANSASRANWLLFIALGFFWGSSYLFIKIGVDAGLTPFTLVTLRLLVGTILLASVVAFARERLPRDPKIYLHLLVLGFFSVALPFSLITGAEQHVDSALAATLTAPVPLFVIPIAAVMLHEKVTPAKIIGVIVGLVGVAVLMGFDPAQIGRTDLTPQLVLIGATISYAFGGVYARRFVHGLRPMIPALFQVFFAMLMVAVSALVFENPIGLIGSLPPEAIVAVVWLGFFGSGLAYLVFFRLLGHWGPTRTSLVAYTLPVWGIALGFMVLHEPIQQGLVLGTVLVIVGIALVNLQRQALAARFRQVRARFGRADTDSPIPDPASGPR
jgi:drug/metabolite transporter (DMT)-like permease